MKRPDHLVFLHIPKTAGSTLHSILNRKFSKSECFTTGNISRRAVLDAMTEEERRKIKLVKGHIAFGVHEIFPGQTTEYFTILREPADRIISHYYHFTVEENHQFYAEFHEKKYSIKELVESGRILNFNNCMVRFFSGNAVVPYNECTTEMLETAIKNLETYFPIIGLNADFDIFLLRLCERYNWHFPYYRRYRVAKNRIKVSDLDTSTRATIEHYNQLDIELYRYMEPKLKEIQSKLPEAFYRRLARFQRINGYAGKLVQLIKK